MDRPPVAFEPYDTWSEKQVWASKTSPRGGLWDRALRRPPIIPQNTTLCCPIPHRYSPPEQLIFPVSMMQNCGFRFFHLVFLAKWKKSTFRSIRPRHDSPGLKVGWWFMLSSDLDTSKYSLDPTNLRGPSIRKITFWPPKRDFWRRRRFFQGGMTDLAAPTRL